MSYLYARYNRKHEKIFREFEWIIEEVDFSRFNINENCNVRFRDGLSTSLEVDLFVLDELVFDISNKIYAIEGKQIHIIHNGGEIKNNPYPMVKNKSCGQFIDHFNGHTLEFNVIDESDIANLLSLIKRRNVKLSFDSRVKIFLSYLELGNIHECFKFGDHLEALSCACKQLMSRGEYYPINNQDEFWSFIENKRDGLNVAAIYDIAVYGMNFETTENNFRKFVKLKTNDLLQKREEKLISFFETQIYVEESKKLSILNGTIDDLLFMAHKGVVYYGNYTTNFLLNEVIRRAKAGETIDRKYGADFFLRESYSNYSLTDYQEKYFFNLIFLKEIYNETHFPDITRFIIRQNSSYIRNLVFDIMMERIDHITGITPWNCYVLLTNLTYYGDLRQKFMDFLFYTSKYKNDDGSYMGTPEGKFFEHIQKYDSKKHGNFDNYVQYAP